MGLTETAGSPKYHVDISAPVFFVLNKAMQQTQYII